MYLINNLIGTIVIGAFTSWLPTWVQQVGYDALYRLIREQVIPSRVEPEKTWVLIRLAAKIQSFILSVASRSIQSVEFGEAALMSHNINFARPVEL